MENKSYIDDLFGKSLENFSVEPPSHIWDNISSELDASSADSPTDQLFSKGLENYSVVPPATVWDNIDAALDKAASENPTDKLFSDKLQNHSVPPPAFVWDNISSKLEATASEHATDQLFAETLANHSVPPPAYVWENIATVLDATTNDRKSRLGWIIGAASAIVIAFTGGYIFGDHINLFQKDNAILTVKPVMNRTIQLDVNRLWNLRNIEIGDVSTIGHTYTTIVNGHVVNDTPGNSNNVDNNSNTTDFGSHKNPTNNIGNFGIQKNNDGVKNNKPTSSNNRKNSNKTTNSSVVNPNIVDNTIVASNSNLNYSIIDISNHTEPKTYELDNISHQSNESQVIANNGSETIKAISDSDYKNSVVGEADRSEKVEKVEHDEATTFVILPYFSPVVAFRNSEMTNQTGIQNAFGGSSKMSERIDFSYSTGLLLGYQLSTKFTLFAGASYNQMNHTIQRDQIFSRAFDQIAIGDSTIGLSSIGELGGFQLLPEIGGSETNTEIIGENSTNKIASVTQQFGYVEVPVLLQYNFLTKNKFSMHATGGLSTGFVVQNNAIARFTDNTTQNFGTTNNIRNFNFNLQLGLGMQFKLHKHVFLNIEPTFRYSIVNWSTDARFRANPILLGLNTGIAIKL